MKRERPVDLDVRRVAELLSAVRHERAASARAGILSGLLLGAPYAPDGLVGSAETPEVFTASLERFDCVTYLETVLALSLSSTPSGFAGWLRLLRYDRGRVEWALRNHYMTGWIGGAVRLGAVRRVPSRGLSVPRFRLLDAVPGLPPRRARFSCVPKRKVPGLRLATGDLVFFASTRAHLDVFHCGLLVADGGALRLRHAARSRGGVVEQDLGEFLRSNRMAGVIAVRPAGEVRA